MDFKERINSIIEDLKNVREDIPEHILDTAPASNPQLLYYRPEHFIIQELVDPKTFQDRGEKSFELLDPYMLWTIDRMRELYGSITINNWKWGGPYKYSGFRPKHCTEGATYSQHRLGRGFDLKFKDHTPAKVREDIRNEPNKNEFKYITCVENDTATWLHIDARPIKDRILWVNP